MIRHHQPGRPRRRNEHSVYGYAHNLTVSFIVFLIVVMGFCLSPPLLLQSSNVFQHGFRFAC